MMTEKTGLHAIVSGKVQGVWFRASTARRATELGVTGWVRNLDDGSVEVLACGDKAQVQQLEAWLQRGPEHAIVTAVQREEVPWQEFEGFRVV
jgi:acylphosphatase